MNRTLITGAALAFVAGAVATIVALSAALPAAGRPWPREDPATFLTRIVGFVVADQYEQVWPSLYPAHQKVAPREEYVACELQTPVGWKLRSAEALRVVQRHRRIPGVSDKVAVTAVTLRLTITNAALQAEGGFTHTFTAVAVGDRWNWILTPQKYRLYRSNACFSTSPPSVIGPSSVGQRS